MSNKIIQISEDFWNIRGSFKIKGLLDVGTHVSLVRLSNGKYVFLDSYTLSDSARITVDELTDGGEKIEAVINVHPFHTVHVAWMQEQYPKAKHYGTARHLSRFPELEWQDIRSEDAPLHEMYSDDLEFTVPRGVDFISEDENVHFSSVMVWHRASKTIHVDYTVNYIRFPSLLRMVGMNDSMSFHPTLAKALEKRAGAAGDFRQWAEEMTERWRSTENLCAAHTTLLIENKNQGPSIHERLVSALQKTAGTLNAHEDKYG